MKKKWTLAIGVTIGAMVFGMAAVAAAPFVAAAPLGANAQAATATTAPGVTATTLPGTNAGPGTKGAGPGYNGDTQPDLPGLQESDLVISATASVTGLTVADVNTQLQAGQSITQIAQSKGKTAADVTTSARATLAAGLKSAVSAGTITQAEADAELAEFDQRAPQMVTDTHLRAMGGPGFGFGHGGPRGPGGAGDLIAATASVTGLTDQEIDTQLQAGQTLAQIAQSKGKTADDVIAAARTALTAQLAQDVTAGRITQAQSDAKLAQFNTNASQLMNDATLGQHAGGPGGPGGHGGDNDGPNGGNGPNNPANPSATAPAASTATNS